MRSTPPPDPYSQVIRSFNRRGVRYVVVGMAGINYYSKSPAQSFSTQDYDLFLEPTLQNVGKAIRSLEDLGFSLGTAEGALEYGKLKEAVRSQRTLVATTPEGFMVELLLKISGYPFFEMAKDAAAIDVRGVPIKVGRLHKLLGSKRLAGRPKDIQFLRRYSALLDEKENQVALNRLQDRGDRVISSGQLRKRLKGKR